MSNRILKVNNKLFSKTLLAISLTTLMNPVFAQITLNGTTATAPDGSVIDTGSVEGFNGNAISVSNGGVLTADGDITLTTGGKTADAVYASGAGSSVELGHSSTMVTTGAGAHAIYAQSGANITLNKADVTTSGARSAGASLSNKGQLVLKNSTISTSGNGAQAITSIGSTVHVENSTLTTTGIYQGTGANALQIANGSQGSMTGSYASTSGSSSSALFVETTNSANTHFDIIDSKLETFGTGAAALVSSELNGLGSSLATVSGSSEILTHQSTAVSARGPGGKIVINPGVSVKTLGANNTALQAISGGQIEITESNVSTENNNAVAMMASSGGSIISQDNLVSTLGDNAHAIQASDVNSKVNVINTNVLTSGNNADAVRSNAQANITLNQNNASMHSANGKTFNALGGEINATLNESEIVNNGILINSDTDSSSTHYGVVNVDASNMTLNGDIQAGVGSQANLSLNNTHWNGLARNGGQVGLDNSAVWNMAGSSDVAKLINAGSVNFSNPVPGAVLTVHGDYIGSNGHLLFNTVLGDDGSATDKMVVEGDTSGMTYVSVTNAGGRGSETVNGIELIRVNGASEGQFVQSGRIVAGANEYYLNKGGVATPNDGGWYLRSQLPSPDPINPIVDPVEPVVDPVNPTTKPISPASTDHIIRPEAGSYMANMAAASQMFNLRLEDREGRAENSSMWLRQVGSRTTFHDTTGQSRTATNAYVIQGGGEVWDTHFNDSDRLGFGVMAAYGNASSETGSNRSGYHSKGSVDGYSAGLYATWYQDAKTLNGVYVDSWIQNGWLNGEVKGEQLSNESYDIGGLSASVETGYRMPVYQGENGNVFITPQAQVIWSGIKADDHHEVNGTRVTSSGDNNVQTRLGVKVSRDGVSDSDKGKDKLFTVYAETNWLSNSQQAGAVLDGAEVKQSGSSNLAELKLGTEGQVNKNLNLWSNVAQQMGDDGYSNTAMMVGMKYSF